MDCDLTTAKRLLGYGHFALAVVVAAHFLLAPAIGDAVSAAQAAVDWLITVGILSAIAVAYVRWRASVNLSRREQTAATVLIIASIVLALAFFQSWFDTSIFGGAQQRDGEFDSRILTTPAFVVISVVAGLYLLRGGRHGADEGANES